MVGSPLGFGVRVGTGASRGESQRENALEVHGERENALEVHGERKNALDVHGERAVRPLEISGHGGKREIFSNNY